MSYVLPKELKSKVKQEELYQITNVFKNFDRTSNGTIAMADVHMCLHSLGERTKAKQEKELFSSHAVDGAVSFKSFVEVLVDFRASGPKAEAKPALTHGCAQRRSRSLAGPCLHPSHHSALTTLDSPSRACSRGAPYRGRLVCSSQSVCRPRRRCCW